jgi:YD repeat-containing protein
VPIRLPARLFIASIVCCWRYRHRTQFTYHDNPAPYLNKQLKSLERGTIGTPDYTKESYDYYTTGYIKDVTDGRGFVTHYDYDALNRVTQITKSVTSIDPVTSAPTTTQNITKTQYYKTGWVKSTTDANNHQTEYKYDGVGRITEQKTADGGITENKYNNIGNLESVTLKHNTAVIKKTEYKYDEEHRITDVKESDPNSGSTPDTTTSYEYSAYALSSETSPPIPTTPKITTKIESAGFIRTTTDTYDRFLPDFSR